MFHLDLAVYLYLKKETDREGCRKADNTDNVSLFFTTIEDPGEFFLPENEAAIVVTDDARFARNMAEPNEPRLRVVFIGNDKGLEELFGKGVMDIWPEGEDEQIRGKRLSLLIRLFRDHVGYWTYRELLTATIDTSPDFIRFKRVDGSHRLVNDVFASMVGKKKEDVIGKDHAEVWNVKPGEDEGRDDCADSEWKTIEAGNTRTFEESVLTHGVRKQITTYKTPLYDWFGNIWGTVCFGHDVTDFSNIGMALSILMDSLPFPVTIFDRNWKVVQMNQEFKGILEANGDDPETFSYQNWKRGRFKPVHNPNRDRKKSEVEEVEIELLGTPWTYIVSEQEIHDAFGNLTGYVTIFHDVTFQRTYEQSILRAANTDAMTGLYNRRYFYDYVNKHNNKPLTLLYMDLDRFKEVNDTMGHAKGDEVIIRAAEIIRSLFPEGVASRLGGDEYAVIMPWKMSKDELADRCGRLEKEIRSIPCGGDLYVTISIGIAKSSGMGYLTTDELIHLADRQMYDAKAQHHEER